MKIFIVLILCFQPFLFAKTDHKLNTYLCLGTKKEYRQCKKSGLRKCQEKNETRYNKELNCPKLLDGLKIGEWNKKYKDKKYEWSETCIGVKKEFKYCKKENIKACIRSMRKRYQYLWCDMVLEEDVEK